MTVFLCEPLISRQNLKSEVFNFHEIINLLLFSSPDVKILLLFMKPRFYMIIFVAKNIFLNIQADS